MTITMQKPRGRKEWPRDQMLLVSKLLEEFTLSEVAEKTGIDKERIRSKASKQGWRVSDRKA